MKKINIMFVCLAVLMVTMCYNKAMHIKTNYYDLPNKEMSEIKFMLNLNENQELTEKSIPVIKSFLDRTVFSGKGQFGPLLSSNYFWNIYNALPSFVNEKERHSGYYKSEQKFKRKDQLLAYSIYRIDRSSENLKKIFEHFKPLFLKIVSFRKYTQIGADKYVTGLIRSYDRIIKIKDYKSKLSNFYNSYYTSTGAMRVEENKNIKKLTTVPKILESKT